VHLCLFTLLIVCRRIVVTDGALQPNLLTAEQVFTAAAKTKHVEIHPIVALLINGMNELNNHKIPRINALTDPSTVSLSH
jgi:hypothetical protein